MKIKEGFELRTICGENVIVGTGRKNIDFSKVISLNESAAIIWNAVNGSEFSVADVVKILIENYEVDEEVARKDAEALMAQWQDIGLIEA